MGSTSSRWYQKATSSRSVMSETVALTLMRGGFVHQLTTYHSLVMEQVHRGLITMDEAEHSKMQDVITRALGVEESLELDLEDHEFVAGDVLLLCSDGSSMGKPDRQSTACKTSSHRHQLAWVEHLALASTPEKRG